MTQGLKTRDETYEVAREVLETPLTVVPHTDADGLSSGAIVLRHLGAASEQAVLLGRGQTPFGPDAPLPPGRCAVLDWGVRNVARPGLIVDHHAPEAEPKSDQFLVSGYGEEPEVTTSILVRRLLPEQPSWLAAVGGVGDIGDKAWAHPECAETVKSHVKKLVSLVNAPRRAPNGPIETALDILIENDDAKAALNDPRVEELIDAKDSWRAEFERAVRVAPQVDDGVALISLSSPFQVHPVVATVWARRLQPNLVVAANDAYLPNKVNFSVRGSSGNLRERLLRALPEVTGEFAHGHDRATGGSLDPEDFDTLIKRLRHESAAL